MKSQSRRSVLGHLVAGGVALSAGSAAIGAEPVLALISAHREATAAHSAALREQERCELADVPKFRYEAACEAACHADFEAWRDLISTAPQTLAGLKAWASYLDEVRKTEAGCWKIMRRRSSRPLRAPSQIWPKKDSPPVCRVCAGGGLRSVEAGDVGLFNVAACVAYCGSLDQNHDSDVQLIAHEVRLSTWPNRRTAAAPVLGRPGAYCTASRVGPPIPRGERARRFTSVGFSCSKKRISWNVCDCPPLI